MTPQLREEIAEYDRMLAVNDGLHAGQAIGNLKKGATIATLRKRIVDSPDWAVPEDDYVLTKQEHGYAWVPEPKTVKRSRYLWATEVTA